MTRKITWSKKELNSGKDSSGVSNIQGINGTEKGVKQGYTHGSLTKGLVAYYPMERGKGQIIRDAAHNNIGQIKGAEWINDSRMGGRALEFNGDGDYVEIGEDSSLTIFDDDFTVSVWINAEEKRDYIIAKNTDDDTPRYMAIFRDDDGGTDGDTPRYFYEDGGTRKDVRWSGALQGNFNEWTHLVLKVYANTAELFINGESEGTKSLDNRDDADNKIAIGKRFPDNLYFDGKEDDVRIYNRALSQPEIEALYNLSQPNGVIVEESDVPSQQDGGVSRWKFDDDSDTDTATDSWSDNHGSIEGAVYTSQRVYGDNAMSFDGESDYIDCGTNDSLNLTSKFTVSVWAKSNGGGVNNLERLVSKRNHDTNVGWEIAYNHDTESVTAYLEGTEHLDWTPDQSVPLNEWNHVVLVWDVDKICKLIVNSQVLSSGDREEITGSSDTPLLIGEHPAEDDRYFSGIIDDVRIYDRALSQLEVEKLYHKAAYRISRSDTLQ